MSENLDLGTASPAPVATGTPSQIVQAEPQKPIDGEVTKMFTELSGKLESVTSQLQGLQGRQQKLDNKTNDFQAQLARLEQYEKKGMSREEAVTAMQNDDAQTQWRSTLEQKIDSLAAQLKGGGTPANDNNSVARVFESLNLDLKDVRVASALVRKYDTPEQVELAAYRLQREISQSPNPSSAQGASMSGNSTTVDYNSIAAEYEALAKDPTAPGALDRMAQIQKELDNLK